MTKIKKWKVLQSDWVLNHKWCQVRQDKVQLPNGTIIDDYFVTIRPDIALVFPVTSENQVVFVRQYRHGLREILLELPAGAFNPLEETGAVAATRELREETGYIAQTMIPLAVLSDNPVKDTNKIHLYLAENVQPSPHRDLDITEEIEIVLIPLTEVMTKIMNGEIYIAGSVAASFLALEFFRIRPPRH